VSPPGPPAHGILLPAAPTVVVQVDPRDPFGSVVAPPAEVVTIPPAPRAPTLDWDVGPFDGARRRRRIGWLFAMLVVIVFGALFGALIWSRVS
jgi:hypothetical protein